MEIGPTSTHKKYQPERPDILWNTDWGIPVGEMPKDEADRRGFLKYKGQWITQDQYEVLNDQFSAYRSVRAIAYLNIVAGIFLVALSFIGLDWRAFPQHVTGLAVLWICSCGLLIAAGIGLYQFRPWARSLTVALLVANIVSQCTMAASHSRATPTVPILALFLLYYLFKPTVAQIFGKRVVPVQESGVLDQEDLISNIADGRFSRNELLSKFGISEEALNRHCRQFIYGRKISESDYLRIVGEPFNY